VRPDLFEQEAGANRERPELARTLRTLRSSDTLVVARLERMGRSLMDSSHSIDFGGIKAGVFQLELKGLGGKLFDYLRKPRLIPFRHLCQLVVCQHEGGSLIFIEVIEVNDGDFR
jgi:hypothetical protein